MFWLVAVRAERCCQAAYARAARRSIPSLSVVVSSYLAEGLRTFWASDTPDAKLLSAPRLLGT